MIINSAIDPYFTDIQNKIELNRCPKCDIGMIIDTPTDRYCPNCKYSDSTNVVLKVKLKFRLYVSPEIKECVVVAEEPDGRHSFQRSFVDVSSAEYYIDKLKVICI